MLGFMFRICWAALYAEEGSCRGWRHHSLIMSRRKALSGALVVKAALLAADCSSVSLLHSLHGMFEPPTQERATDQDKLVLNLGTAVMTTILLHVVAERPQRATGHNLDPLSNVSRPQGIYGNPVHDSTPLISNMPKGGLLQVCSA